MTNENKDALKPCPFCGKQPQFGLQKKTGCQLHGDPIQNVTLSCKNQFCHAKPCVVGGDRYASGYEKGEKFKECEQRAKDLAVKYWEGTRAQPEPPSNSEALDTVVYYASVNEGYQNYMQAEFDAAIETIRAALSNTYDPATHVLVAREDL